MLPPRRVAAACLAVAVLGLAGCGSEIPPPGASPEPEGGPTVTEYVESLEPAAAVLPFVPASAQTLMVTDYDRVKLQFGRTDLDSSTPEQERRTFWEKAEARSPILVRGALAGLGDTTRQRFGFTRDDVAWEAEFTGPDGDGAVLGFREGVDMRGVEKAVQQGAVGLRGAAVRTGARLLIQGGAQDPQESWGADDALVSLVGPPAISTYVERGCVSADQLPEGVDSEAQLEELEAWAVQLQGGIATVRLLGADRHDLFARMQLSSATGGRFGAGFTGGVADPSTSRIGFRISDGARAAELTRARMLPFAACAG